MLATNRKPNRGRRIVRSVGAHERVPRQNHDGSNKYQSNIILCSKRRRFGRTGVSTVNGGKLTKCLLEDGSLDASRAAVCRPFGLRVNRVFEYSRVAVVEITRPNGSDG